jgi:hypothetical protein
LTFVDSTGARVGGAADARISNGSTVDDVSPRFPDVQWTGSAFGVVWAGNHDGAAQLYYNRVVCTKPSGV